MRKYLTWRCIGLHATVLVLVPAFLFAGWWQYHVALGGNDLGWVYTVEWPAFAVYAVYIWWKLIHDQSTSFDRLWAAKQRAAANAEGRPLHEIPGWATDKALAREVHQASNDAARYPALSGPRREALDAPAPKPADLMPAPSDRAEALHSTRAPLESIHEGDDNLNEHFGSVIDAEVVQVKVNVDEKLDAYNRYLFELSRNAPPKRWGLRRRKHHDDAPGTQHALPAPGQPTLPSRDDKN